MARTDPFSRRTRRSTAALFLLLVLGAPSGAADDVRIFEPSYAWDHPAAMRLAEQDLLFNEPYTSQFGSRTFTFMGLLDNGVHFLINVFRWRYSFWRGWGLSVLVAEPDGTSFVYEEKIPEDEMNISEDRFMLRFGENRFEGGDGRYRIRLDLEGFSCDLTLTNLLPLWQPGDGYVYLTPEHDAYMRLGVHSPWARTSGTMVVRGRRMSAEGQCYGDRSRYSMPINRLNSVLTAFRVFSPAGTPPEDRWTLSVLCYRTHESFGSLDLPVILLAHGGEWVFTTRESTPVAADLREEEGHAAPYPGRFEITAASGGYALQGAFIPETVYHYTDIFEKLPGVLRGVASLFFKRPVIFRLVGFFEGTLASPDGSVHRLRLPGQCEYYVVK